MHLSEKEALNYAMLPSNIPRKIESTLNRVKSFQGNEENKKLVLEYDRQLYMNGNALATRYTYLVTLYRLQQFAKNTNFHQLTKEDIMKFLDLEKQRKFDDTRFKHKHGLGTQTTLSETTLNSRRHTVRKFFAFVCGYKKGFPPVVDWMKVRRIGRDKNNKINPSDILTPEEIYMIISHAESPRDRALLSLLAESGCRVGEISTTTVKDVVFNENGFELTVKGKTGLRTIPLVVSRPDVENWLNNFHMFGAEPEAPLFPRFNKKQLQLNLQAAGIWNVVKKTVARARLVMKSLQAKNISPHSFRHARATELAALGWTEAMLRVYFGWTSDSTMPSIYIHLSQSDVGKCYYRMYGKMNGKEEKPRMLQENKPCHRCGIRNPTGYITCFSCHKPINDESDKRVEDKRFISETMNYIARDNDLTNKFLQLLEQAAAKQQGNTIKPLHFE
jgi:integrase